MKAENLVQVDQLSHQYGEIAAVSGVSFSVSRGEVLGLLGPNGAGKSTTMQIICGVMAPTSGTVRIAGFSVQDEPARAKHHLGFLPEIPPLYRDLTVDEYLRFSAELRGIAPGRRQPSVDRCKERCGLKDSGRRLIGNLSKGFQQRVGIAQAIVHAPDVVVLDEPTSGLDPNQILEIRQLISELGEEHSVVLSTHILQEVQSSCDRVLIMNRGRLVYDDKTRQAGAEADNDSFIVAFGNPPLPEELEQVDGMLSVGALDRQRFRISCKKRGPARERMIELSVARNWQLLELLPERVSLEQIFVQLTQAPAESATPEKPS